MIAENKFGVSKPKGKLHHLKNRILRKNIAKAETPFDWSKGITGRPIYNVKNQYQSDSCFGQAGSRAIQILLNSPELSAKSLYSQCYANGGGVWYPDGQKILLTKGLTTETNVPSTVNSNAPEPFMEDTSWRTPAIMKDCFLRAGYTLQNVPIDINSIANAIKDYQAVIFIVQGQNDNGWLESIPTPPSKTNNNPIWEHFLCFNSNQQPTATPQLNFYNSWGTSCGNGGFQYLSELYINSGYVVDVFAVVPFQFTSNLSFGSMGTQVSMLQEMLRKTGDFAYPTNTGFFGLFTMNALIKYQKRNNITPSVGYFGSITRASLNQMLASLQNK